MDIESLGGICGPYKNRKCVGEPCFLYAWAVVISLPLGNPKFLGHIDHSFCLTSKTAKSMSSGYLLKVLSVRGRRCTFENKNICETVSTLNSN